MSLSSTSSTDNHKDELPLINHGSEPTSVVKPQDTATSTIIVDESPQDSQISQSVSSSSVASSHEKKPKRPRKPPSTDPTKTCKNKNVPSSAPRPAKFAPADIRNQTSILGSEWAPVYEHAVEFGAADFEKAMSNIILEPNLNSTSIMRTDIISDELVDTDKITQWLKKRGIEDDGTLLIPQTKDNNLETKVDKPSLLDGYQLVKLIHPEITQIDPNTMPLSHHLDDIKPRDVSTQIFSPERKIVRRIIPRNPQRDPIINQTCAIHTLRIDQELRKDDNREKPHQDSIFVAYIPHIQSPDECPFYLPPVRSVGVLYHNYTISVHYLLYEKDTANPTFAERDSSDRMIRIALHLLETPYKHAFGAKTGYKKRVHHDVVVPKVIFQDKYVDLKAKYAKELVSNWVESTDPKKHVFEDLAIAAFIIELWNQTYDSKDDFTFVDIGCGNGLLVNILLKEGYKGYGVDARERKSWATYSQEVQDCLKEQVIVPKVLIDQFPQKVYKAVINDPSDEVSKPAEEDNNSSGKDEKDKEDPGKHNEKSTIKHLRYSDLLDNSGVNVADFPKNAFLIGNHSDELTCWAPLFNCPFIVIPCCSYSLAGSKCRYTPKTSINKSTYASLVDHVQDIATAVGWDVEKEILRIPSTRNSAIIGRKKLDSLPATTKSVEQIIEKEGGAVGWVERTMALHSKNPRNH